MAMTPPTTRDMGRSSWPMSSISSLNLASRVATVWRRGKVKVKLFLSNTLRWTRTIYGQTLPLPYEITEIIIVHLTHDLNTLKACSLTCRSWYIVTVPHLHHTLTLRGNGANHFPRGRLEPLSKLHGLDLIPLVKEIRVKQTLGINGWFGPQAFSRRDLRYFSAFANVQALVLQRFQIYRFLPGIERYFEHFSPTLRSITLLNLRCTPRQLSYFLSLFSNLDDIEIRFAYTYTSCQTIPDAQLVPFSTPSLRGRLALHRFRWAETWADLIASRCFLRFRYMDLRGSESCTPILLEACAETLETLRLSMVDGLVGLDLSRLKVLRCLQVAFWVPGFILSDRHIAKIIRVFATITSPVFSELVIVVGGDVMTQLPQEATLFETLRTMNSVRPFKLVFLLEVSDPAQVGSRWPSSEASNLATVNGLLTFLDSPPTTRVVRSRYCDWDRFSRSA